MNNLSLHYGGGSGGFIGLHILLETDRYFCVLDGLTFLTDSNFSANFDYLKLQQWNITEIGRWKNTEKWPDNIKTENSTSTRSKIFFHCNYFESNANNKTILIYTDIDSQLLLSKHKNANWYGAGATIINRLPLWQEVYHDIKENDWDNDIDLLTDFGSLPKYQQEEISIILSENSQKRLLTSVTEFPNPTESPNPTQITNSYKTLDNGTKVTPLVAEFYKKADYCVSLQDLINTSGKALLDLLDLPHTNKHNILVNHWKKLHPVELLKAIGIDPAIRA